MENFDFESLNIRGYYLPANPQFMRLLPKTQKDNFEIKLILLTLASCTIRRVDLKPTSEQKQLLFKFILFVIEEFPQHTTVRTAVGLFYDAHQETDLNDLAFISQYDEFCAGQFELVGEVETMGPYSACMHSKEPAKTLNAIYRQMLWNLVLEAPELLPNNSGNYALEMLIFMDLLKGEKSSDYHD